MTQGLILLFQVAPALRSAGGRVAAGTLRPMAAPSRLAVVHCHARAHAQDAHSSLRQHHSVARALLHHGPTAPAWAPIPSAGLKDSQGTGQQLQPGRVLRRQPGHILLRFFLKGGTVSATAEKQGFCLPHARVVHFFSA